MSSIGRPTSEGRTFMRLRALGVKRRMRRSTSRITTGRSTVSRRLTRSLLTWCSSWLRLCSSSLTVISSSFADCSSSFAVSSSSFMLWSSSLLEMSSSLAEPRSSLVRPCSSISECRYSFVAASSCCSLEAFAEPGGAGRFGRVPLRDLLRANGVFEQDDVERLLGAGERRDGDDHHVAGPSRAVVADRDAVLADRRHLL